MEPPPVLFALMLLCRLVTATPTTGPDVDATGPATLAADVVSTTSLTGDTAVTDNPTAELKVSTEDLDAPTTKPHVTSGTISTADPTAFTTYGDAAIADQISDTAGPTSTTTTTTTTRPPPVCPPACECDYLEVHCSRAGLRAIPDRLSPRITYLDLGHNLLTAINDDELANLSLTKLKSLICDDNLIETVGRYAFRGLRDLSLLQLSGNRIRELSPFVFVGNNDLRHIDLTGNPLQLAHGPILMIQQLEWLDLDNCNITQLSLDAFRDMRGLRYLNLSGNRLSRLTLSHFHGLNYLRYIKLSGNPLLCNCEMKPVWRWFRQQSIHVDAKCIAPASHATQSWNYLEKLNCEGTT